MKNLFLLLLILIGFFTSCISFKNEVERNSKITKLLFERLASENGNAFALTATHVNSSRVWTYNDDKIEVYKIVSGKITQNLSHIKQKTNWLSLVEEKDGFEFDACIELDGDGLKYMIIKKDSKIQNTLPINIKCFIENKKKNDFYDHLAKDIKTFELELY